MHFDETREAYLAEFDRLAAEAREDLADPKFQTNRWCRDGFPFADLGELGKGVHSLNRLEETTAKAAWQGTNAGRDRDGGSPVHSMPPSRDGP